MRIGCCVPIEKYEQAHTIGYDFAEFPAWEIEALSDEQFQELLDQTQAIGLPVLRMNSYCRGTPVIAGEGVDHEKTRSYARRLMKRAAALGVRSIGIGAPAARRLPEGYDKELADQQCEQFLRITAEEAAPFGIVLLVEAVQHGFCNYINELKQAEAMVQRVALPQVGLMADLYNMETQGESLEELGKYAAEIQHVHVSTIGEGLARGLYGDADQMDCDRAFRVIAGIGYDGTVSIEPDASALTEEDMTAALRVMRCACG